MTARRAENLWILFAGPTVWAAHFLLSYVFAAIYCTKAASVDATLAPARSAVAIFTLVALAVIAVTGAYGWRRLRASSETPPHDERPAGERRRFMGLATLLLSGLSAVATIYVAVVVVFFENCR